MLTSEKAGLNGPSHGARFPVYQIRVTWLLALATIVLFTLTVLYAFGNTDILRVPSIRLSISPYRPCPTRALRIDWLVSCIVNRWLPRATSMDARYQSKGSSTSRLPCVSFRDREARNAQFTCPGVCRGKALEFAETYPGPWCANSQRDNSQQSRGRPCVQGVRTVPCGCWT